MFGPVIGSVVVTFFSVPLWAALQCSDIFMLEEMPTTIFPVASLNLENDFHSTLGHKIKQYTLKLTSQRELLADTAERLFVAEKNVALKTGKETAPEILAETRELLLGIYGANSQLSAKERQDLIRNIEEILRADPYFAWLAEKAKLSAEPGSTTVAVDSTAQVLVVASRDPVQHFLASLTGESSLPLSVALWRLRREMDPSLHLGTRSVVDNVLKVYRQEQAMGKLLVEFQKVLPPGPLSYVWNYAKGLEHAQQSREQLLGSIRKRAGHNLSLRQYELIHELLPYEVVLLRRFFEPKEGERLESLLMALNTIIEVAQKVDDANVFR